MESSEKKEHKLAARRNRGNIHYVLAHSYSFYFLLLLVGISLDLFFPIKIFSNSIITRGGFLLLVLASLLILWAQATSRDLNKEKGISPETFCQGPYCYTRSPTHWGLFLLMLGFGIVINAFFVVLSTLISFLVSKFFFLKKGESIMEKKYGAPYLEYKKLVRF